MKPEKNIDKPSENHIDEKADVKPATKLVNALAK